MNYFAMAWCTVFGLWIILFPEKYKRIWVRFGDPPFLRRTYAKWSVTTYRLMGLICIGLGIVLAVYAK